MEELIITGGKKLKGEISVSGAKNVTLKALVAACLTKEEIVLQNVPLISDLYVMIDSMNHLGFHVSVSGHTVKISAQKFKNSIISLENAIKARTSAMFIAPLLARVGEAMIPNPGGCRLGARPIDRTINGIMTMNVNVKYHSEDGYFHAKTKQLKGTSYFFEKNTHTGTETVMLTAVLAKGKTVLKNAAEEPEIDELIKILNGMGAKINRVGKREIVIEGVETLHGGEFTILPDRNEIVTFGVAALITCGDILVRDAKKVDLSAFKEAVLQAGGGYEEKNSDVRVFYKKELAATNIQTSIYPGFMTDWQAPWAVLMTQAKGLSTIHETVFEYRFGYVKELKRMGAKIEFFNPDVKDPESVYNFNLADDKPDYFRAIKIEGPTRLHNAVVEVTDLRAGATLVLASLTAYGQTTVFGVEKLDRGYENFENRLTSLGASIYRQKRK